jgi:predicted ribosome quality control (RQC) complex YloA/Tae2 family protein
MAFDGAFLSRVKNEIEQTALGAKLEKIAQPSRDELVLHLHRRDGGGRLLLSAGAGGPRVHFTAKTPENPLAAPMFCMLLRKRLAGARLGAVRQIGLDRILFLDFDAYSDLGDPVTVTLAAEIMGRHSNIIAIGPDGRVMDAIRHVNAETSSVRQVLPGIRYELPPLQGKLNPMEASADEILARISGRDVELSKALLERLEGLSPIVCRELAHYATRGVEVNASDLTQAHRERLAFALGNFSQGLREGACEPTLVAEPSGRPREFTFIPVSQYGPAMLTRAYASCGELLDAFYAERDRMERVKQRSGDLLRFLANASGRLRRKLALQAEELRACAERDAYRVKADLINANAHALAKGMEKARLQNFYDESGGALEIALDPRLSPAQNAQRYYALYRKAATAEKALTEQMAQSEAELAYIDSVFDSLTRAAGIAELDAIRDELVQGRYLRRQGGKKDARRPQKLPPLRYRSSDGFLILAGRNNAQNDQLTLRESKPDDIWLHTQKIHGAHVVIATQGTAVTQRALEEAACIAAYQSQGRESGKVPVDYALVRHVKKPAGARPGMVTYANFKTLLVSPDERLVESLAEGNR